MSREIRCLCVGGSHRSAHHVMWGERGPAAERRRSAARATGDGGGGAAEPVSACTTSGPDELPDRAPLALELLDSFKLGDILFDEESLSGHFSIHYHFGRSLTEGLDQFLGGPDSGRRSPSSAQRSRGAGRPQLERRRFANSRSLSDPAAGDAPSNGGAST